MLDRFATLARGLWVCIKALLHGFEQMLMLPSRNPPLRPCSALRFERTILTGRGPEAPYPLAILLVRKPIRQLLPSRTAIGVFLRQIDNVLFAEAAKRWSRKPSSISAPSPTAAGGSIEFVNAAALVHRRMGKIPKCCRIIDER